MDYGQLLRAQAERVWHHFRNTHGEPPEHESLYETLCTLAESLDFAVDEDPALLPTNVQGVCSSDEQMIRLRPNLSAERRVFVLAHEIGHLMLKHPGRIADTSFHIQETVSPSSLTSEELRSATGIDLPEAESLFAISGYSERDRWKRRRTPLPRNCLPRYIGFERFSNPAITGPSTRSIAPSEFPVP